jgi:hypothetical protein
MRRILIITVAILSTAAFAQDVIISEINYNSAPAWDTEDWLEFYNTTPFIIDMTDWVFKDANDSNLYVFPEHTFLDAGEFIVLCRDTAAFTSFNPGVSNYIGEIDFNLSNGGELIRLYDATGAIVDSLTYDDAPPWPLEPDGTGPTLSLMDPGLPGYDPASWEASAEMGGTPGSDNGWVGVLPEPVNDSAPASFRLSTAYPNPFNPETNLQFDLSAPATVRLTVADATGKTVVTLADGHLQAGVYRVTFDAAGLPAGVYFARLSTGQATQSQKLILLK